jgi:hypothetical protein
LQIGVAFVETFAIAFLVLSVLPGIGLLLIQTFYSETVRANFIEHLTMAMVFGLGVLDLLNFVLAKFSVSPVLANRGFFYLSVLSIGIYAFRLGLKRYWSGAIYVGLATLVGFWESLPGLFLSLRSGGGIGMVTRGNNDIAYYVAVTNEYLHSGFINSNHLSHVDLNFDAQHHLYFTPMALISLIATGLGLAAWQIAMPAIIAACGFAILGISRLVKAFYKNDRDYLALGIASLIMMTSLMAYIYTDYFLGEILAVGISSLILANVLEYVDSAHLTDLAPLKELAISTNSRRQRRRRELKSQLEQKEQKWRYKETELRLIEVVFLMVLSIFSYPHLLVPIYIMSCAFGGLLLFLKKRNLSLSYLTKYPSALLVGVVISAPYLSLAFGIAKETTSANSFGWTLPQMNPLGMFVWPQMIGFKTKTVWLLILWIGLFLLIGFVFKRSSILETDKRNALLFVLFAVMGVIGIIVFRGVGFAEYPSWKLIAYFIPLTLAAFLPVVFIGFKRGELFLVFALGISIISSQTAWGGAAAIGAFTNSDLDQLSNMQILKQLRALNVDLNPYVETMAMASMLKGPKLYFNSTSYLARSVNPSACTLIRLTNKKYMNVTPLNATYGLATSQTGSCKKYVNFGEVVTFDGQGSFPLGQGWAPSEVWGTWSVANTADLDLPINPAYQAGLTLALNSQAFVAKGHESVQVDVLANTIKVSTMKFTMTDHAGSIHTIWIPPNALAKDPGHLYLTFVIKTPATPLSLGLTTDKRRLGMGLISIELKDTRGTSIPNNPRK